MDNILCDQGNGASKCAVTDSVDADQTDLLSSSTQTAHLWKDKVLLQQNSGTISRASKDVNRGKQSDVGDSVKESPQVGDTEAALAGRGAQPRRSAREGKPSWKKALQQKDTTAQGKRIGKSPEAVKKTSQCSAIHRAHIQLGTGNEDVEKMTQQAYHSSQDQRLTEPEMPRKATDSQECSVQDVNQPCFTGGGDGDIMGLQSLNPRVCLVPLSVLPGETVKVVVQSQTDYDAAEQSDNCDSKEIRLGSVSTVNASQTVKVDLGVSSPTKSYEQYEHSLITGEYQLDASSDLENNLAGLNSDIVDGKVSGSRSDAVKEKVQPKQGSKRRATSSGPPAAKRKKKYYRSTAKAIPMSLEDYDLNKMLDSMLEHPVTYAGTNSQSTPDESAIKTAGDNGISDKSDLELRCLLCSGDFKTRKLTSLARHCTTRHLVHHKRQSDILGLEDRSEQVRSLRDLIRVSLDNLSQSSVHCPVCYASLRCPAWIREHLEEVHGGLPDYREHLKRFEENLDKARHKRRKDRTDHADSASKERDDPDICVCEVCSLPCENLHDLLRHMEDHHGQTKVNVRVNIGKPKVKTTKRYYTKCVQKWPSSVDSIDLDAMLASIQTKAPTGKPSEGTPITHVTHDESAFDRSSERETSAAQSFTCLLCMGKFTTTKINVFRTHYTTMHRVYYKRQEEILALTDPDARKTALKDLLTESISKQKESGLHCPYCLACLIQPKWLKDHLQESHMDETDLLDQLKKLDSIHSTKKRIEQKWLKEGCTGIQNKDTGAAGPSDEVTYKCVICDKVFIIYRDFKAHPMSKHGMNWTAFVLLQEDPDGITAAREEYQKSIDMKAEKLIKTGRRREQEDISLFHYICPLCSQAFPTPSFAEHLQTHVEISETTRQQMVAQLKHMLHDTRYSVNYNNINLTCSYCHMLKTGRDIFHHMEKAHGTEPDLKQHLASMKKLFKKASHVEAHKLSQRRKDMGLRYKCKFCPKLYNVPASRSIHEIYACELNPNKKRLFRCKVCGITHTDKAKHDLHIRKHQTAKPEYVCTECGKSYKGKSGLYCHQKMIHQKKVNHTCGVCGKQFFLKTHYDAHMSSHKGG